ncbi:MAG: hypothetical protein KC609_25850 [Myxococcales bacterium]|nr:hypothetical protein [Myxococcales bacterium]
MSNSTVDRSRRDQEPRPQAEPAARQHAAPPAGKHCAPALGSRRGTSPSGASRTSGATGGNTKAHVRMREAEYRHQLGSTGRLPGWVRGEALLTFGVDVDAELTLGQGLAVAQGRLAATDGQLVDLSADLLDLAPDVIRRVLRHEVAHLAQKRGPTGTKRSSVEAIEENAQSGAQAMAGGRRSALVSDPTAAPRGFSDERYHLQDPPKSTDQAPQLSETERKERKQQAAAFFGTVQGHLRGGLLVDARTRYGIDPAVATDFITARVQLAAALRKGSAPTGVWVAQQQLIATIERRLAPSATDDRARQNAASTTLRFDQTLPILAELTRTIAAARPAEEPIKRLRRCEALWTRAENRFYFDLNLLPEAQAQKSGAQSKAAMEKTLLSLPPGAAAELHFGSFRGAQAAQYAQWFKHVGGHKRGMLMALTEALVKEQFNVSYVISKEDAGETLRLSLPGHPHGRSTTIATGGAKVLADPAKRKALFKALLDRWAASESKLPPGVATLYLDGVALSVNLTKTDFLTTVQLYLAKTKTGQTITSVINGLGWLALLLGGVGALAARAAGAAVIGSMRSVALGVASRGIGALASFSGLASSVGNAAISSLTILQDFSMQRTGWKTVIDALGVLGVSWDMVGLRYGLGAFQARLAARTQTFKSTTLESVMVSHNQTLWSTIKGGDARAFLATLDKANRLQAAKNMGSLRRLARFDQYNAVFSGALDLTNMMLLAPQAIAVFETFSQRKNPTRADLVAFFSDLAALAATGAVLRVTIKNNLFVKGHGARQGVKGRIDGFHEQVKRSEGALQKQTKTYRYDETTRDGVFARTRRELAQKNQSTSSDHRSKRGDKTTPSGPTNAPTSTTQPNAPTSTTQPNAPTSTTQTKPQGATNDPANAREAANNLRMMNTNKSPGKPAPSPHEHQKPARKHEDQGGVKTNNKKQPGNAASNKRGARGTSSNDATSKPWIEGLDPASWTFAVMEQNEAALRGLAAGDVSRLKLFLLTAEGFFSRLRMGIALAFGDIAAQALLFTHRLPDRRDFLIRLPLTPVPLRGDRARRELGDADPLASIKRAIGLKPPTPAPAGPLQRVPILVGGRGPTFETLELRQLSASINRSLQAVDHLKYLHDLGLHVAIGSKSALHSASGALLAKLGRSAFAALGAAVIGNASRLASLSIIATQLASFDPYRFSASAGLGLLQAWPLPASALRILLPKGALEDPKNANKSIRDLLLPAD